MGDQDLSHRTTGHPTATTPRKLTAPHRAIESLRHEPGKIHELAHAHPDAQRLPEEMNVTALTTHAPAAHTVRSQNRGSKP